MQWILGRNGVRAAVLLGVLVLANTSNCEDIDKELGDPPAPDLIVRVSEGALNALKTDKEINSHFGVRDVILGTSLQGSGRTIGQSAVRLNESAPASFDIQIRGTVTTRTTGYNGPAILYSRSVTTFSATKRVLFETGRGFYGLPPVLTAQTRIFLEGISSRRGGLIGRIVVRRATRLEAAQRRQAEEITRQKVARRIASGFDAGANRQLAQLNRISKRGTMLASLFSMSGLKSPQYSYTSTHEYLQFTTRFDTRPSTSILPILATNETSHAPIEIWFHPRLFGPRIAAAWELAASQINAPLLVKVFSILSDVFATNLGLRADYRNLFGLPVDLHDVAGWKVLAWQFPQTPVRSKPRADPKVATVTPSARSDQPTPPADSNLRIWTSGQYTAYAEFLAVEGDIVRLRRSTGVRTSIPFQKLSFADQAWIRAHLSARSNPGLPSPL